MSDIEKNRGEKQSHRFTPPELNVLARSFADLPEFEWTAGPFHTGMFEEAGRAEALLESKKMKHVQNIIGTNDLFFARFTFRRARVYLAYAPYKRLDDLLRYADALTYKLWPYRERGANLPMRESVFNFSSREALVDLEEWSKNRSDITNLLNDTIECLVKHDIIKLPEQRAAERLTCGIHSLHRTRSVAGKVESVLARNQEYNELFFNEQIGLMRKIQSDTLAQIESLRAELKTFTTAYFKDMGAL